MEMKMEQVNTQRANSVNTDKLMHDLRLVVEDAEDLIKATATQGGEKVSAARAKAEESIRAARARLVENGEYLAARAQAAVQATDKYAHDNTWTVVGTGASLGFLVGYLIGRR
jgi:ElaB/YqjD/DUF883 family membrane-anchored ribosome-binding protein